MENDDWRLGFEISYRVTAEELAEARRWVRFFRLGRGDGILALSIIGLAAAVYLIVSVVGLVEEGIVQPAAWFGLAMGLGGLTAVVAVVVRARTVRERHVLQEILRTISVIVDAEGIIMTAGEERVRWTWDQATGLQGLEHVWVLSTWREHLVIPRSAAENVEFFEARVWEYMRKQSAHGGFEVVPKD